MVYPILDTVCKNIDSIPVSCRDIKAERRVECLCLALARVTSARPLLFAGFMMEVLVRRQFHIDLSLFESLQIVFICNS